MIIQADARHLPLPDGSVDLICTSPPYFGLRDYRDGGDSLPVQIGSEATPGEWVAALVDCTREWVRVLKPSGSLFVNLGDKYGRGTRTTINGSNSKHAYAQHDRCQPTGSDKSLLGLPWRYAHAVTDQLGLILRAEIIWAKANSLPESVGDRVRRAHEQVFHFTVRPRYYSAVDEIREPQDFPTHSQIGKDPRGGKLVRRTDGAAWGITERTAHPLGKLPGSVWTIPSAPLTVPPRLGIDHFAAFPPALVRPIVLGWSPAGICTACGEGRRPVAHQANEAYKAARAEVQALGKDHKQAGRSHQQGWMAATAGPASLIANEVVRPEYVITGYACACPQPTAPTRPAVVLDPFGGTGTTALVAAVHGRHGISVDLSADYCRIAAWRVNDPGERARAADVPKPPPVIDGQGELFGALL